MPFDLYFYPWLERSPITQPTQEAFQRMVADNQLDLKSAGPPDRNHCEDNVPRYGRRTRSSGRPRRARRAVFDPHRRRVFVSVR